MKVDEKQEDLKKLKEKKAQSRHSLLMIEMNRTMEFKKLDSASKVRRVSKFNEDIAMEQVHKRGASYLSNFSSKKRDRESVAESLESSDNEKGKEGEDPEVQTMRRIQRASFIRKSHEF